MSFLLNPAALLRLAGQSLPDPQGVARLMLAQHLPRPVLWQFFALQTVLSAMVKLAILSGFARQTGLTLPDYAGFGLAWSEALVGGITAALLYYIGRAFGGAGQFNGALTLVIWLQFILMLIYSASIGLSVLLPALSGLAMMATAAVVMWLMVHFVAELHGFRSRAQVFPGVVATLFLAGLALSALGLQWR